MIWGVQVWSVGYATGEVEAEVYVFNNGCTVGDIDEMKRRERGVIARRS